MTSKGNRSLDSDNINIDGLDGHQFEELVAKVVKRMGYENISITPKSNDFGKDIIMEKDNEIIVVECKHQHFVGRPIIQKLQGAMNHELTKNPGKNVKGMIVTSGSFSQKAINYSKDISQMIELIDGKGLKKIFKELDITLLNGKVQVLNNKSFKIIGEEETKKISSKNYYKLYGSSAIEPKIKSKLTLLPICYITYNVEFKTHTSVGCIDEYNEDDALIINGLTGKEMNEEIGSFFFSGKYNIEEINEKNKSDKIPYEFTENDIEEHAINHIVREHTHAVYYRGQNNVSYRKNCVPKRRDINIKQFIPLYLPVWKNDLTLYEQHYMQEFYSKGNHLLLTEDEIKICKICQKEEDDYEKMNVCPECGRIVCGSHVKIDYLDKKTPICSLDVKSVKLFIQEKYFASKETKKKYQSQLKRMNFFRRVYEDKILSGIILFILVLLGFLTLAK